MIELPSKHAAIILTKMKYSPLNMSEFTKKTEQLELHACIRYKNSEKGSMKQLFSKRIFTLASSLSVLITRRMVGNLRVSYP